MYIARGYAIITTLAVAALAGCAEYKAENKALVEFPGIQNQIENYYDANATEDDWVCDSPQLDGIDKSRVVSQSATQVQDGGHLLLPVERPLRATRRRAVPGLQHPILHLREGAGRAVELGQG